MTAPTFVPNSSPYWPDSCDRCGWDRSAHGATCRTDHPCGICGKAEPRTGWAICEPCDLEAREAAELEGASSWGPLA